MEWLVPPRGGIPAQTQGAEAAQCRSQELPGQSLTGPPIPRPAPPTAGSEAEGFLGGVDHVEEAIVILLLLIDVRDGRGHAHHAVLVHQQEEGLRGVQLQAAPEVDRRRWLLGGRSSDFPQMMSSL